MEHTYQQSPTPEQHGNSRSKTVLHVVIGIVVLLLLGFIARGMYFKGMMKTQGVDVDRNTDNSFTYDTNGSLPENWPDDAPNYPNGSIQYSGTSNPQTGEAGAAVMFLTNDSSETVVDYYKRELPANGWTITQTAVSGTVTVIAATKDNRSLGIYIAATETGQTSVTVGVGLPKSE